MPRSSSGVLLVALGACLWGTDALLRRPLTGALSSFSIVFFEHLILTVVLLPLVVKGRNQWKTFEAKQWAAVLWIGWAGSALGLLCFTQAIKLGNPTTAVFLQKLQPLVAVTLARWRLKETQLARTAFRLRLGLALAAAYLVSFGLRFSWNELTDGAGLAALLAAAAAVCWGYCTVVGRYAAPWVTAPTLTALRVTSALPLLLMLVWWEAGSNFSVPGSSEFRGLLLMAFIPGLLGLTAYYQGLKRTPASVATLAELCFPASAALLNWAFLDVRVSAWQLVGVALLAVAVIWRRPRRAAPADGPDPG